VFLKIVRVQRRSEFFTFLNLVDRIYGQNSPFALANRQKTSLLLHPGTNPALSHVRLALFIAYENNKPAGRIACAVDEFYREKKTVFFGAFEAVPSEKVTPGLMEKAEEWLRKQKCEIVIGPVLVNTNQQVGLLVNGPPPFAGHPLPYNPPYYRELLENYGYKKLTDLLVYQWSTETTLPENINRVARRATCHPEVMVQPLNFSMSFYEQVKAVHYILNRSMERNWGYIPLTISETRAILTHFKRIADPRLLLLARVGHQPAGICFCVPLPGKIDKKPAFRLALLAVVPEFRQRGIDALLLKNCHSVLPRGSQVEISQIHEGNIAVLKMVQRVTTQPPVRRYRVYQKNIP
jgi:GNAT superfamily N-acetyltransferase